MSTMLLHRWTGLHAYIKEGLSLLGYQQGRKPKTKGRKFYPPALPYSRPTALESLLSVALSSVEQFDFITQNKFCDCGLVFVIKMGSFSM
jgi:hypothetical protein